MKKLFGVLLIILPCLVMAQNVGIGTTSPNPNAALEIKATNKGILIPRGDAATRAALNTNTAKGLLLYDTVLNNLWIHNGNGTPTGWSSVSFGTNYWQLSGAVGNEVKNSNAGGFWSANSSAVTSDPGTVFPPAAGAGTRLMWIPAKSAFRVGTVDGSFSGVWDVTNIGAWSLATGRNTMASGAYSTAMGFQSLALSNYSFASGWNSQATGGFATAIGLACNATGDGGSAAIGANATALGYASTALGSSTTNAQFATSMGYITNADGDMSTATGWGTVARALNSFAIGMFNDSIASSNPIDIATSDPVLYVGNGTRDDLRSNAAVIYKNGSMMLQNELRLQGSGGTTGIEFGNGVVGKEINAGRMGYAIFTPGALDIVGAGTNNTNRRVNVFAEGGASFNGCVTAVNISCPSDIRLKRDITPLQNGLQTITQLNGYNYYWKDETKGTTLQTGVIAQELQKLAPNLVQAGDKGELSVNYNGLIPYLIEAIKEQQKEIEQLKRKINNQ